jgi:predicted nucleic acid-binding protein
MSRYLLDVSALVALGLKEHEFFEPVVSWVQTLSPGEDELATCAITELGFVRALALPQYGLSRAATRLRPGRLRGSSLLFHRAFVVANDAMNHLFRFGLPHNIAGG